MAPIINPPPLSWKVEPLSATPQYINSVGISADGSKIITGTYFHDYSAAGHSLSAATPFTVGVFAYDHSQNLLWKDEFQASEGVYWVAISRNGSWASACGLEMTGQGFISAYNAATGTKAFEYKTQVRANWVTLNEDGSVMVAGANRIFVFARNGTVWNETPQVIASPVLNDTIVSVAVSADGKLIIAGTLKGVVMMIDNSGAYVKAPVCWQLPGATFHWVAMAADGSSFVAGGSGSEVYYFTTVQFQTIKAPSWSGALTGSNSCRSVAISDNGTTIAAVANTACGGNLYVFDETGKLQWTKQTIHSPNSTSMDATGQYVTVADGFPDGKPGSFNLYDPAGNVLWNYTTPNMSWPMSISANAKAIAAGSDDSFLYYFTNP